MTGKKFEELFKEGAEKLYPSLSIDRFRDSMGGYAGINTICDFVVYRFPWQYYFELKCYKDSRVPLDALSENQYDGLREKAKIKGVRAGVVLCYYEYDEAYFLPISYVEALHNSTEYGSKSINIKYARQHGTPLTGTKRRIYYNYDIGKFLEDIDARQDYSEEAKLWLTTQKTD